MNASEQERERCERTFKRIQEANSLIGDSDERRKYDSMSIFKRQYGSGMRSSSSGGGFAYDEQQAMAEEAFRQFFGKGGAGGDPFGGSPFARRGFGGRMPQRRAFYVNGIDISHLFDPMTRMQRNSFGNHPFAPSNRSSRDATADLDAASPRSVFVETVTVPLEDLYNGVKRKVEFQLSDNILQRYRAAFRGGVATKLAIQCFFTSLPLLIRISWPVSLISFLVTFHLGLPRPSRLFYFSRIKPGWKGGTKLKFADVEPGMDVIFILNEGKHNRFQRDGNDLRTSISIGKSKAEKGCTLFIEPLGSHELPVTVKLKRGEIKERSQVVTVKGKGWPISGGGAGDLQITVNVVSDTKAKRLKRRNKAKAQR